MVAISRQCFFLHLTAFHLSPLHTHPAAENLMRPASRIAFYILFWTVWHCPTGCLAQTETVDFASQIQPLLAKRCYACHGPDSQEAGIRFDQRDTLTAQADSGQAAIVPGRSDESELIRRVISNDEATRMPPEGNPLSSAEVLALKAWIDAGAHYTKHWAFQPINRPALPLVNRREDALQPLDLFVLNKLERAGMRWQHQADPATLILRVYWDVTGLPPSPEVLAAWLERWDESSYADLVDQLLASPSMGERWARMWLDVVRYAESNSFERDNPKPNAWRFRDYIVRSFNSDKPFNQFVREQIAGDELDQVTTDSLIATGYYRLGLWDDEPADPLQARFDEYDDLVTTTGQAFLALTVNCARCHDHKIDPITQRDYYAMVAFLRDVTSYGDRGDQSSNNQLDLDTELAQQHRQLDSQIRSLERKLRKLEQLAITKMSAPDQRATEGEGRAKVLAEKLQAHLDADQWQEHQSLKAELSKLIEDKQSLPPRVTTLGLAKLDSSPPKTHILLRGSPQNEGPEVEPAFPELLGGGQPDLPANLEGATSAGRRRVLADWLASDKNWLTARVIVNRIWLHYFGRGIVRSPNNFGLMGDPPTHPELLDYLASNLIENGWTLKDIHRQILLSSTYQRSSQIDPASQSVDPSNNLFWRQNIKRLGAEQVRDGVLSATGQLNLEQSGPPMYPTLSAEVLASQSQPGRNWEHSPADQQARRSVYIHVKRSLPVPMLSVFDFPETDSSCEARFLTIQPAQALTLLNSQWMQEQAQFLLQRVEREVGKDLEKQAARCLQLCGELQPQPVDVQELVSLVERLVQEHQMSDLQARRSMALVALNLNRFLFLD